MSLQRQWQPDNRMQPRAERLREIGGFSLEVVGGNRLAAIIMTSIIEGRAGLLSLRRPHQAMARRLAVVSVHPGGHSSADFARDHYPARSAGELQGLPPLLLVNYAVYFVAVFFGVGLPEEIGWRGFALPRMQPRYGPQWGTLLLGVLWAFWHLLYFLTPGHGGGPGTGFDSLPHKLLHFFLMVVALAIIFTWVFNHTRGSIFIAKLMHAAIDTPQLVWAPLFLAVARLTPPRVRPAWTWLFSSPLGR